MTLDNHVIGEVTPAMLENWRPERLVRLYAAYVLFGIEKLPKPALESMSRLRSHLCSMSSDEKNSLYLGLDNERVRKIYARAFMESLD